MAHRLAPQAAAALDEIWYGIARESGNVLASDRVIDAMTSKFWPLVSYPHIRRKCYDLRQGLRGFPLRNYVILYRIEGQDVLILHILHGRRDIPSLLAGED